MELIELIINENEEMSGIEAISLVENPAIESNFIALKDEEITVKLTTIDTERRLLMGAALIPDKPIYRRDKEREFYIFFSKDTVVRASQLYLKNGFQSNATLDHKNKIEGVTMVESWIVEDDNKDKSRLYNLNAPVGTWMVTLKIDDDKIWTDYVKSGNVKGFSIEGIFADKLSQQTEEDADLSILEYIKSLLENVTE